MTGNASTRSVGTEATGRSEPKSPTPMGGASVSEVLAAAADLLEKPGAWGQKHVSTNGRSPVDVDSSFARCFCVVGALRRVTGTQRTFEQVIDARRAVARSVGLADWAGSLVAWNDAPERTQAEVVDALRQAARQASNPTAEGV